MTDIGHNMDLNKFLLTPPPPKREAMKWGETWFPVIGAAEF